MFPKLLQQSVTLCLLRVVPKPHGEVRLSQVTPHALPRNDTGEHGLGGEEAPSGCPSDLPLYQVAITQGVCCLGQSVKDCLHVHTALGVHTGMCICMCICEHIFIMYSMCTCMHLEGMSTFVGCVSRKGRHEASYQWLTNFGSCIKNSLVSRTRKTPRKEQRRCNIAHFYLVTTHTIVCLLSFHFQNHNPVVLLRHKCKEY